MQKRKPLIVDPQDKIDEYNHICGLLNMSSGQQLLPRDRSLVKKLIRKDVPCEVLTEAALNLGPAPLGKVMFLFIIRIKQANEKQQNKEKVLNILAEMSSSFGKKKID